MCFYVPMCLCGEDSENIMSETNKPSNSRGEVAFIFAIVLGLVLGTAIKKIRIGIMIGLVLGILIVVTGWLRSTRK